MLSRLVAALLFLVSVQAFAQTPNQDLTVITYNTHHAQSISQQLDVIAAQTPRPTVVVLNELNESEMNQFVTGLNSRYGVTDWVGHYYGACQVASGSTCTTFATEGNALLTRETIIEVQKYHLMYADAHVAGRPLIRVKLQLDNGAAPQVFAVHQPTGTAPGGSASNTARRAAMTELRSIADGFPNDIRLIGGDFNNLPNQFEIVSPTGIKTNYADAWEKAGGAGGGYTWPNPTVDERIDYWFSRAPSSILLEVTSAIVPAATTQSDHRPVVVTYSVPGSSAPPTGDLLRDDFNDGVFDTNKWSATLWSGPQNSSIPMQETGGALRIGDLLDGASGLNFNGFSSKIAYSFTGRAVHVAVTPASQISGGFATFTVGRDSSNYYRWYVQQGILGASKRIGGVKTSMPDITYNPTAHRYLRISHNSNEVRFETSPDAMTWVVQHHELWNTTAVPLASIKFEMKAGTENAQTDPGTVAWDDFRAYTPTSGPTVLLADDFNDGSLATVLWTTTLWSGASSSLMSAQETNGGYAIGPLLTSTTGLHFKGIASASSYDFSGGSADVELVRPPDATALDAFATYSVGVSTSNYYRWYVSNGKIGASKRIGGTKTTVVPEMPYNAGSHAFLRISHNAADGKVRFETSGDGELWAVHFEELWNTTSVPLSSIKFEMKAGTEDSTTAAGNVIWDNFRAIKP